MGVFLDDADLTLQSAKEYHIGDKGEIKVGKTLNLD
jgi:hypothetical protein